MDLSITSTPKSGGVVVCLEGAITERADLRKRLQSLSGAIVFDLKKVSKITSFGVREWIIALNDLWKCHYAFINVPPPMMTQFNIVSGFAGHGELISFFAPYHCESCDEDSVTLIDLRRSNGTFPVERTCHCGAQAELAELADLFFAYARSRPHPHLAQDLEQLVHAEMGGGAESPTVRKDVSGEVTALWISGPLTTQTSLRRALEDVEGFVIADLSGVTTATVEGIEQIKGVMQSLDVRYLAFSNVRLELVPLLSRVKLPFRCAIISVLLRETCNRCRARVDFEITQDKLRTQVPDVPCPMCGEIHTVRVPHDIENVARVIAREIPPEIADYRRVARGGPIREPRPRSASPVPRPVRLSPTPAQIDIDTFIGSNAAMKRILETVHRIAPSDATVLVRGETGTGKEMLARLVHALSSRRDKPFVAVNCAALAPGIIESELFGHERGAFTGATARQMGRFERANEGTLFIDEIGDMPLDVQVKVLRSIQEHYVERLGGSDLIPVNIRLVAATHRPLEDMMRDGSFREDLFYRLNVIPIVVPPLRERREDIWPLALYYLMQIQQRFGKSGIRFSSTTRESLESYAWPGNVRELINVVERAVALTPPNEIAHVAELTGANPSTSRSGPTTIPPSSAPMLPLGSTSPSDRTPLPRGGSLKDAVGEYERRLILEALSKADGNRTRAARDLGISRQALGVKLAKYGLD